MNDVPAEPAQRAYDVGLGAAARCRLERLWLSSLRPLFGFDAWHAAAPYCCRGYKKAVVELANGLRPGRAVEVGCGLGDIITRIKAGERIGIDVDAKVLRAARFLHPGRVWIQAGAAGFAQFGSPERRIDCLIMVNWIHTLSSEELAEVLLPNLSKIRYLIVDAVDAHGPPSYRYKHDFAFLGLEARQISATRVKGEPRTFLVYESLR